MIIATTTGTSALRPAAMVKNAISGIAWPASVEKPTVGILNVDNAAQVERSLRRLIENGLKCSSPNQPAPTAVP